MLVFFKKNELENTEKIFELSKKIDEKNSEIEEIKILIENKEKTIAELTKEKFGLKRTIKDNKDQFEAKLLEIKHENVEIIRQFEDIETLKLLGDKKIEELELELIKCKDALSKFEGMKIENFELKEELARCRKSFKEIEEKYVKNLEKEEENRKNEESIKNIIVENLKNQLSSLNEEVCDKENQILGLNCYLEVLSSQIDEFEIEIDDKNSEIQRISENYEKNSSNYVEELRIKEDLITDLQKQVEILLKTASSIENNTKETKEKDSKIKLLELQKSKLQSDIKSLETDLQQYRETIFCLEKKLESSSFNNE